MPPEHRPSILDEFDNGIYVKLNLLRLTEAIETQPWVVDGLTRPEWQAVNDLLYAEEDTALAILDLPLPVSLRSIVISSLARLSDNADDDAKAVLAHASLQDGITEAEALLLVPLGENAVNHRGAAASLLEPGALTVESRVITLPYTGETTLAILRRVEGSPRTMEFLEKSVRGIEDIMRRPYPNRHIVMFAENVGPAGVNYATHMTIQPRYDIDAGYNPSLSFSLIAHETAHFHYHHYGDWGTWIVEGVPNFLSSIVQGATQETIAVTAHQLPGFCQTINTVDDMHRAGPGADECGYYVGESFFVELYKALDEEVFYERLRALYELLISDRETRSIDHLKTAFEYGGDAATTPIIDKWHGL